MDVVDVNNVIDNIASKIGVTNEYIIPILSKHYYLHGILQIFTSAFLITLLICLLPSRIKKITLFFKDEGMDGPFFACGALFILIIIYIINMLMSGIGSFINPEYNAIMEILKAFK